MASGSRVAGGSVTGAATASGAVVWGGVGELGASTHHHAPATAAMASTIIRPAQSRSDRPEPVLLVLRRGRMSSPRVRRPAGSWCERREVRVVDGAGGTGEERMSGSGQEGGDVAGWTALRDTTSFGATARGHGLCPSLAGRVRPVTPAGPSKVVAGSGATDAWYPGVASSRAPASRLAAWMGLAALMGRAAGAGVAAGVGVADGRGVAASSGLAVRTGRATGPGVGVGPDVAVGLGSSPRWPRCRRRFGPRCTGRAATPPRLESGRAPDGCPAIGAGRGAAGVGLDADSGATRWPVARIWSTSAARPRSARPAISTRRRCGLVSSPSWARNVRV